MKGVKLAYNQITKWKLFCSGINFVKQKTCMELTCKNNKTKLLTQKYLNTYLVQPQTHLSALAMSQPTPLRTYIKLLWKPTKTHFAYKGKSFRVINQKKKNRFILKFSRCHKTYLYVDTYTVRYKKNKYFKVKKEIKPNRLHIFRNTTTRVRRYSIYTTRGIQPKATVRYKKKGKASTYR